MPELPEVETLRRELSRAVAGKTIRGAKINWPKIVKPLAVAEFNRRIKNKKIVRIDRRAKILILKLADGPNLLIHLKLTGQLIFLPRQGKPVIGGHPQENPLRFTRAVLNFTDGSRLLFNDLRKFGWLKLVQKNELNQIIPKTTTEPLSESFTPARFAAILARYPKRKIKQLLMDQALIAGLGNIYADEACFNAGILPQKPAGSLPPPAVEKLRSAIQKVLRLAISKKGTSADTYVQLNGAPGGFVPFLKVYGRKGEKCKRCGGVIKKIKLGGRGTHYCPKCQH